MLFNSYSDEELNELFKKSQVDVKNVVKFVVTNAFWKKSSKNHDMFELSLDIYQDDIRKLSIKDWIVFNSKIHYNEEKLKRFFQAAGLDALYAAKSADPDEIKEAEGECKLKQREFVNDDGVKKNTYSVDAYLKRGWRTDPAFKEKAPEFNDDIPY